MKVVAFIPARCGSQAIRLKNIKPLCGKPLIYWTLQALETTTAVDEAWVATDCDEIEEAVKRFGLKKTHIYRRKPQNARDTSSTESVMLEFLEAHPMAPSTIFILAQATSPFTQTRDFSQALALLEKADSVLSCVRIKRFFWEDNGTPLNYDYRHRPRRQDFEGALMENGAFYINTVGNILRDQNRLSGEIRTHEMPEYTATELDEDDDWPIAEMLMRKYVLHWRSRAEKIKIVLSDVDGVLTDASMYYSENGDELKRFCTYDGMGFQLLREQGYQVGIITTENRTLNQRRAEKMQLDFIHQGVKDKLGCAKQICEQAGVTLQEVAFVGDDLYDLPLLWGAGLSAAPANAHVEVKRAVHWQLDTPGGQGAFREFAERLLNETGKLNGAIRGLHHFGGK